LACYLSVYSRYLGFIGGKDVSDTSLQLHAAHCTVKHIHIITRVFDYPLARKLSYSVV